MKYLTWRNIILLIGALLLVGLLVGGVSSCRVSGLERKIAEQAEKAAAAEAEAAVHRKRADDLEKEMAARDQLIAAKDVLIDANSKKADQVNQQIQDEDQRYRDELAAGADADLTVLRARICARFAAAKISAPEFCR